MNQNITATTGRKQSSSSSSSSCAHSVWRYRNGSGRVCAGNKKTKPSASGASCSRPYFVLQHTSFACTSTQLGMCALPSASFYSCIFLDASVRQAASAVSHSFRQLLRSSGDRHLRSARECERLFGGNAVMCLSVRSAFDALLTARAFPKGSHVLMSGEFPHIPTAPHTHTPPSRSSHDVRSNQHPRHGQHRPCAWTRASAH